MTISLIAAVAKNNVIGHENDLPWYLPEDLKRFKSLTIGKTVIMGRKTYESIIKRLGKPLPQRKNIIVTRDPNYQAAEGVVLYHDLETALRNLKNENLFVIGGGQVFAQAISHADRLYITHVDKMPAGNTFFPQIDPTLWQKINEEKHEGYTFVEYRRQYV